MSATYHTQEPAPAIAVRYFYTSPFVIDDPLSPLPPPLTGGTSSPKRAPRPFSIFDNAELDRAWLDVRKKLLKLTEQNGGQKPRSRAGTTTSGQSTPNLRPTTTARRNIYDPDSKRRSVVAQDAELASDSARQARPSPANEELQAVKGRSMELTGADGGLSSSLRSLEHTDPSFLLDAPATTGKPFTRLPSRTNIRTAAHSRQRSTSNRPPARGNESYNWGEDGSLSAENEQAKGKFPASKQLSGPQARVAVGVSRLHNVVIPELQYVTRLLGEPLV